MNGDFHYLNDSILTKDCKDRSKKIGSQVIEVIYLFFNSK